MQNKFNEATAQRPQGDRLLNAPLVKIDLVHFVALLKDEKNWKEGDRNAITVFKATGMSILLIALQKGAEMPGHSVPGIVSIQVIEGAITLTTEGETAKLSTGQMLALHNNVEHNIIASEAAFFLLTISTAEEKKQGDTVPGKTIYTEGELLYNEIF